MPNLRPQAVQDRTSVLLRIQRCCLEFVTIKPSPTSSTRFRPQMQKTNGFLLIRGFGLAPWGLHYQKGLIPYDLRIQSPDPLSLCHS